VKKRRDKNASVEIHANGESGFMRPLIFTVTAAISIISLLTACEERQPFSNAEADGLFDVPISKETVDLGASPYYPDENDSFPTALSCYCFPDFMVKTYDLAGRGAEWLSILLNSGETPECKSSHDPGEIMIEYPEREAYFMGVKGNLAFFNGSDTVNGGLAFAVYDSSKGAMIFEDSVYSDRASSSSLVEVVSTSEGYLLKYFRAVLTDCNLNTEGTACWNEIKAEYALRSDDMPACTGYDHIADLVGTDQVDSMIAYSVEVSLSPLPAIRSVAAPVRCWPSH
jgi:hypothetical protein